MKQADLIIGRSPDGEYITLPGFEHAALYAKTRSGKTTSSVIPNAFNWPGSLVVLDVRREIFKATAGHRATALGQEVYLLDPASPNGRSHRWNPLAIVDRTSEDRFDQISRVSLMMFPDHTGSSGTTNTDKFWDPAGRSAYNAVATLIAETPEWPLTHAQVLRLFSGAGIDVIIEAVNRRRSERGKPPYSQSTIDGLSGYISGDTQMVEGIRKTVEVKLQAWFNHKIAAATSSSDFDLRDLRRKPMTIYVGISPSNIARWRSYLALFFEQLVNLNVDETPQENPELKVPLLVVMDEFARLGRMQTIAEAAQYAAGYGMRFFYVIQNKRQLEAIYGDAASADIFDNTGVEIIFGTNDQKTTKEVSERFGDDTVMIRTQNRPRYFAFANWQKQSEAEHPHRRPGLLPQEIARMGPDEQIVLRAGMQPMMVSRLQWFKDPAIRKLELDPPVIPVLQWKLDLDDGKTKLERPKPKDAPSDNRKSG
jgi:type IV secretion system protein VirD4